MAWTNIFDLCDWDIYVQYNSMSSASPNSKDHLVHIDDFDPSIGSITVVDGEIVMSMTAPPTGAGGSAPYVVAVPKGAHPGGNIRMTYTEGRDESYVSSLEMMQCGGVAPTDHDSEWAEVIISPNPITNNIIDWDDPVATLTADGAIEPSAAIVFHCVQVGL